MDGADSYNWDESINPSHNSEAPHNDPSDDDNPSNASDNDDIGGTDSTDDELEEELLGDISAEDLMLVLDGSTIEAHQARLAFVLLLLIMADEEDTRKKKYHNCSFTGPMRVQYYLNGHEKDMEAYTRMKPESYLRLCSILRDRRLLSDTQYMTVEEQLFIFMCVVSQHVSNTNLADLWQRSAETISRWFGHVLHAICALKDEFLGPPNYNEVSGYVRKNAYKYLPWFSVIFIHTYSCINL